MAKDNILFKYLNQINFGKRDYLLNPECEEAQRFKKEYQPFVINTFLAAHRDTIMFANEMNSSHIPAERQFVFLLHSIRPRKRFSKWPQQFKSNKDIEYISKYYNISTSRAKEYLKMHTEEQLQKIRDIYAEN